MASEDPVGGGIPEDVASMWKSLDPAIRAALIASESKEAESDERGASRLIVMDGSSVSDAGVGVEAPQEQEEGANMCVDDDDDDDDSFKIEEVEDVPTDDELECSDTDEDSEDDDIEMKPKGYSTDVLPSELGEDSKALLLWREKGGEKTFTDWRIKVVVETEEGCEEKVTTYNVHRTALALGPTKCGYFEALLESDSFSENSECTSTVKFPQEIAAHFPIFLDYLYAQPMESKFTINFENWKSMKYLADYFLVSRLTRDVADFIEKDMDNGNLEHIEDYVREFHRNISDDMSRKILPKAAFACAEMILSIEMDSSLLMAIPPAMFRSILWKLNYSDRFSEESSDTLMHVSYLIVAYLEHNVDDASCVSLFFGDNMGPPFWDFHNFNDSTTDLALAWFQLMERKGWKYENINWGIFKLRMHCAEIITGHLRSPETPSPEMMKRIVKEAPHDVVAELFRKCLLDSPRYA
ncbi:hypothetical protein ACHAWF_002170 [Thalassiosira exigua]